jgi:hypothetical protein
MAWIPLMIRFVRFSFIAPIRPTTIIMYRRIGMDQKRSRSTKRILAHAQQVVGFTSWRDFIAK